MAANGPGTDGAAHTFPVSVKGVALQDGKVLLLENERSEWELPGGKLELGEDPADCVAREISEESGWDVVTGPLLDCWQYHIRPGADVLIVTYGCHVRSGAPPVVSSEHKRAGLFSPAQVPALNMPAGYKRSIAAWLSHEGSQQLTPRLGAVGARPMRPLRGAPRAIRAARLMPRLPGTGHGRRRGGLAARLRPGRGTRPGRHPAGLPEGKRPAPAAARGHARL